jgi:regulator of protease activity HflC (stomatin/prohibitin superfamily)
MEQNSSKTGGLINVVVALLATAAGAWLAVRSDALAGYAGLIFLGTGAGVTLISLFHIFLEQRERVERLEYAEIEAKARGGTLFGAEAGNFPAKQAREQFERWGLPTLTLLLLLAQLGAIYWIISRKLGPAYTAYAASLKRGHSVAGISEPLLPLCMAAGLLVVLFLRGKYVCAMARFGGQELLRPGGGYLLLGSYLYAAVALVLVAAQFHYPLADIVAGWLLAAGLILLAIENLFRVVFEAYRPRVKGQEVHLLYDSRLVGFVGRGRSVRETVAHTLDYQFGFKVSETWGYQFLQERFFVLAAALVGLPLLSTCVVIVKPNEQALLERFGQRVAGREVLDPGLHFKWPWPMDRLYRFQPGRVQSFNIGFVPDPAKEKETTSVWTASHAKEEYDMLVSSRPKGAAVAAVDVPVSLLSVSIPVQFQITNVVEWAYQNAEAAEVLENVATREVVRYLLSVDLDDIMTTGRSNAVAALRERIQGAAASRRLGVQILYIGLQDIHPPVKIAADFETAVGEQQRKQVKLLEAQAAAYRTNVLAGAEAFRREAGAESEFTRRTAQLMAQATQFTNQIHALESAPQVFPQRAYLAAVERALAGVRKFVVIATNTQEVVQLNLEEKVRKDILDIKLPPAKTP